MTFTFTIPSVPFYALLGWGLFGFLSSLTMEVRSGRITLADFLLCLIMGTLCGPFTVINLDTVIWQRKGYR